MSKIKEGFLLALGTMLAQGVVEAAERAQHSGHTAWHPAALALVGASYATIKLMI